MVKVELVNGPMDGCIQEFDKTPLVIQLPSTMVCWKYPHYYYYQKWMPKKDRVLYIFRCRSRLDGD